MHIYLEVGGQASKRANREELKKLTTKYNTQALIKKQNTIVNILQRKPAGTEEVFSIRHWSQILYNIQGMFI